MKIKLLLLISMFILASCNLVEPDPDNYDWCYTYNFAADASFVNLRDGVWESGLGLRTIDGSLAFSFQKSGLYVSHTDVQEMTVTVRRGEYLGTISVAARFDIFGMAGIFRDQFIESRTEYTASLMSYISERTPQGDDGSVDSNIVNVNLQTADEKNFYIKSFSLYGKGASPFSPNECDDAQPTGTPTPEPTSAVSETPSLTPTPTPSQDVTPTATPTPVSDWCAATETLFTDSRITKSICLDFRQSSHSWVMPQNQLGQSRGQYVPGEGFKSRTLRTANSGTAGDWTDRINIQPPGSWGFGCYVHAVAIEFSWSLWPERTNDNSTIQLPGTGNTWNASAIPGLNGLAMFDNSSYCMNAANMAIAGQAGLSTSGPGNGGGYVTIHSVRIGYSGAFNQPTPTMAPTSSPTSTVMASPTPTHTTTMTPSRTPIGWGNGTPSKTPSPSRTPVTINTWTPQPPTVTRTPSVTVIPPTIAATPTLITVTPQTYTPVYTPTMMPSLPGPTMTPWGTPIYWGTPWGTPVDWGTPWLPGDGGFGGICCGNGGGNYDDAVYGWLATAAAEVNKLPDTIAPYVPNPNTSQIFGYAKWLLSCVSAQEIVGRTLSPIVCHLSFGLQIILFVTSVYLSIRLITLAFRIGAWIVRRMAGSVLSIIFGFLANVLRGGLVWAARLIGRFFGGPIGWVISAIATIAGIFGLVSEEFGFDNLINQAIDSIGEFLAPIFAPITEPLNKIAEMTTMVFDIVLGIFSFLATAFFEGFNSLIGILIDYATSPVLSIPTLPQCTTAPMQHNLCALWYLLDWTFLAENTPGALIIPLIVVGLDIFMIAYIVRRIFNIIRTGERTIGNE